MKTWRASSIFTLIFLFMFGTASFANKSSVTIDAPDKAKKGESITIKINVNHRGNNFLHYTNWVYLKANGKEIKRWNYSGKNLPESDKFSLTVRYTVKGKTELEAQANCNLHGSEGKKKHTLRLR